MKNTVIISAVNSINWQQSNTLFIIDTDVTINGNIQFGTNSGLVFQGGMIRATAGTVCKLTGNSTTIEAPIDQIFGDNIDIDGTWRVDKTFPQWFGAVTYTNENNVPTNAVAATFAINKAIKLAGNAETFFPEGIYVVDGTIRLPQGGSLRGASAAMSVDDETKSATLYLSPNFRATNENTALIDINVKWQNGSPSIDVSKYNPTATVSNIRIINHWKVANPYIPVAILVSGGAIIDKVMFRNFPTAVKYFNINGYYDLKRITNCYCSNWMDLADSQYDDIPYAFELSGLGDALIFQHNAVSGILYNENATDITNLRTIRNGALKIAHCGGGLISDNILNGDVEIRVSKAVTFSNNHMEYGAQLHVYQSVANISCNWFEIGPDPSLVVKGSRYGNVAVASLSDNCFILRDMYNVHSNTASITTAEELRVKSLSNYDIILSKNTEVEISNSFRYLHHNPGISNIAPIGVTIQKSSLEYDQTGSDTLTDFTEFNSKSCWLSFKSIISKRNITNFNWRIETMTVSNSGITSSNSETNPWLGESGTYSYQVQVIWDKIRGILGTISSGGTTKSLGSFTYNGLTTNGMRIIFNNDALCILRVVRTKSGTSGYEYCDVPICGTTVLYDNGVMLQGKSWQKTTTNPILSQSMTGIQKLQFLGENLTCLSTANSAPTFGSAWKAGDIVTNIGSSTSWTQIIKKQ